MNKKKFSVLTAMPPLKDTIFGNTVILMGEKNPSGYIGIIINLPTKSSVHDAMTAMDYNTKDINNIPVLFGGPVQTDFFWALHSTEYSFATTIPISKDFSISSALDIFSMPKNKKRPKIYLSGMGYSGWDSNQLEREITEGSWWFSDILEDILFSTPHEKMWDAVFKSLGVDTKKLLDFTDPFSPSVN